MHSLGWLLVIGLAMFSWVQMPVRGLVDEGYTPSVITALAAFGLALLILSGRI